MYELKIPLEPITDPAPLSLFAHENPGGVAARDAVPLDEAVALSHFVSPTVTIAFDKTQNPPQARLVRPEANDPMAEILAHGGTLLEADDGYPVFAWIETRDGRFDFSGYVTSMRGLPKPPKDCRDLVKARCYIHLETGATHVMRWWTPWPVDFGEGIPILKFYSTAKHLGFRSRTEIRLLFFMCQYWLELRVNRVGVQMYNNGHRWLGGWVYAGLMLLCLACLAFFTPLYYYASLQCIPVQGRRALKACGTGRSNLSDTVKRRTEMQQKDLDENDYDD